MIRGRIEKMGSGSGGGVGRRWGRGRSIFFEVFLVWVKVGREQRKVRRLRTSDLDPDFFGFFFLREGFFRRDRLLVGFCGGGEREEDPDPRHEEICLGSLLCPLGRCPPLEFFFLRFFPNAECS